MRIPLAEPKRKAIYIFAILTIFCALIAVPLLSSARSLASGITVTNNSNHEIRHVYLSPVDNDDWGADQLNGVIRNGENFTISNVACVAGSIKVVAEDANGCFLYHVVDCTGDAQWTITNSDTPDCGQ
jgi:hypothetical protein